MLTGHVWNRGWNVGLSGRAYGIAKDLDMKRGRRVNHGGDLNVEKLSQSTWSHFYSIRSDQIYQSLSEHHSTYSFAPNRQCKRIWPQLTVPDRSKPEVTMYLIVTERVNSQVTIVTRWHLMAFNRINLTNRLSWSNLAKNTTTRYEWPIVAIAWQCKRDIRNLQTEMTLSKSSSGIILVS